MDLLLGHPRQAAIDFLKLSEQEWLLPEVGDVCFDLELDEVYEPPMLEEWNGGSQGQLISLSILIV